MWGEQFGVQGLAVRQRDGACFAPMNAAAKRQEVVENQNTPFRLWGYGGSVQALLLTRDGLVIRNGEDRVLIPRQSVSRFQEQLADLIEAGVL